MRHVLLLAFLVIVFVLPLVVLGGYALAPRWQFPHLIPEAFDFGSLAFLYREHASLMRHMMSSVGYSLATVLVSLVMCYGPARVMARQSFAGRHLLEGFLLAPALVPPMTFAMGLHVLFIRMSLADTLLGVVLVLAVFSYPYMLRALIAGFHVVDNSYALCAANLGASPWTVFARVELPLLLPAIIAGGSVVFLVAFSEYFLVFLIGGGAVPSFTGYLFPILSSSNRSLGSVLTLVFVAVPLVFFVLIEWVVGRSFRRMGVGSM
ncbi:ABC transporter permease [Desulfoplanes formicivorans]|uniref:ABC transporter n=1 Tax=Desulfoplanes formicivorans TaxID=1592317 RepID=A0A194AM92_9BACT|nr:ABC transporter permease subunit [Desulfoplanes formicivorans]GAU09764.1 ABC transporter [Desulfoplanes formicivorans]